MASNLPALTLTWPQLDALSPCSEAVVWGHAAYNDQPQPTVAVLRRLIHEHHEDWANWLIVRCMSRPQFITYAIFAAEQVIDLYERQCPGDARPRQAIAAARACLNAPGDQTAGAAEAAARDAGAATWAARTAENAARAAVWAAGAVENAAWAAAWAAGAAGAARTAENAAWAAWAAAENAVRGAAENAAEAVAYGQLRRKILRVGLRLLMEPPA